MSLELILPIVAAVIIAAGGGVIKLIREKKEDNKTRQEREQQMALTTPPMETLGEHLESARKLYLIESQEQAKVDVTFSDLLLRTLGLWNGSSEGKGRDFLLEKATDSVQKSVKDTFVLRLVERQDEGWVHTNLNEDNEYNEMTVTLFRQQQLSGSVAKADSPEVPLKSSDVEDLKAAANSPTQNRKIMARIAWQPQLDNFGLDKSEQTMKQMQRVAERWVSYALSNNLDPANQNEEMVSKFLDSMPSINPNTRARYGGILQQWFTEVTEIEQISSQVTSDNNNRDMSTSKKRGRTQSMDRSPHKERKGKISGYTYGGTTYECESGKETLIRVLQHFSAEDPMFLERLAEKSGKGQSEGTARVLVAQNKEDLYPKRFKARSHDYGDLGNGWWVGTNMNSKSIVSRIELACTVMNKTFGEDLKIIMK